MLHDRVGYMKKEADRFLPFVEDGLTPDMESYVKREVEPMGKECEQVHIIALTEYLQISVRIEYLDGQWVLYTDNIYGHTRPQIDLYYTYLLRPFDPSTGLSAILCPETSSLCEAAARSQVILLYRPGHYDVLYPL